MTSNQDLADQLLVHKLYLLGYSKQVAQEVSAYLKQSEPEVRQLILKLFGTSDRRVITRLRDAEGQLRQIRSKAWKRALEFFSLRLLDLATLENTWRTKTLANGIAPIAKDKIPAIVSKALLAGNTLKEVFTHLERVDGDRAVAQLRIAYLSKDETAAKASGRLTGRLSFVAVTANNAIATVSATAVMAVVGGINTALLVANSAVFDTELWLSILDSSTTSQCRALNGRKFPVGIGVQPGFHFHCRSERVPYIEGNGPVKISTYEGWIARQPKEVQDYAGTEFSFSSLKPMNLNQVYKGSQS